MATTHAPGTGIGSGDAGKRGRRTAIVAAVVLVLGAIVAPFGVRGLDRDGRRAAAAPPTSTPSPAPHTRHQQDRSGDVSIGPRGDLPALLPVAPTGMRAGARVRLGDVTTGVLRRTPAGAWQVAVRWNGRVQPVATRGPVSMAGGAASWLSADRLLYTRVATGAPGRFRVYAWEPHGGTAYHPPTLVATALGHVCFNPSFTAFGSCTTSR
jgi:hypothetical protein